MSTPLPAPSLLPRYAGLAAVLDVTILALCLAGAAGLSLALGQDASWDLQNYHYYSPWAWTNGERGYTADVVAAQLQTYHNPLPDLPFFRMVEAGWDPTAIAIAMALPAGVAAFLLWKLLAALFLDWPRARAVGRDRRRVHDRRDVGTGLRRARHHDERMARDRALSVAALYLLVRPLAATTAAPCRAAR